MKKNVLIFLLSCICYQGYSQVKMNKVSINPVQLLVYNIGNMEFERGFNNGKLGVAFYYGRTGATTRKIGDYEIFTSEQNVTLKGYSKSIDSSSFWFGTQLSVASANIYNRKNYEMRATELGILGLTGKIGYQFIIKSFYLDLYGGVGFALTDDLYGNAYYRGVEKSSLLLNLGIKTGIAF